jgi:hypothetical protein
MYITNVYYCSSTKQFPNNYLTSPHMVQNTETYFDKPMLRLRLFCESITSTSPLAGLRTTLRARHAKYRINRDDRKIEAIVFISYTQHYYHRLSVVNGTDWSHGTRQLLSRITVGQDNLCIQQIPKRNSIAKHGLHNRHSSDTDYLVYKGTYYKSSITKITDFKLSRPFSINV